ncbi:hypothetical protein KHQ81_15390 (plasmid) [Mycoplasmatota bacterium]|nr:hypothetical protein KHQ81_15390 [Mycoplasmatota bacterium]
MAKTKNKINLRLSSEAYQVLNDYKSYGFQSKNDLIMEAVNRFIIKRNFMVLINSTLQTFNDVYNNEIGHTLTALEDLLKETNLMLLKNKRVFLNDFLKQKKIDLDWSRKLKKYLDEANEEINSSNETIRNLVRDYNGRK